jgi:thiol:disulfide interchange protein DsbD
MLTMRVPAAAAFAAAALLTVGASAADRAVVRTDQVRAELVAHAPEGVFPGRPLWLGLKIDHQPHWHTYWKNPGDSGLPTTLQWSLPAGWVAGEIAWPTPKPLPVGPLMNFGYEETLLLPVPVEVPAGFAGDAVDVKLRADWLVCKDVCIPEGGDFSLRLPARAATSLHAELFDAARAAQPQPLPGGAAQAEVRADGLHLRVRGLPPAWHGKPLRFLPETAGVIDNVPLPAGRWQDGDWVARVPLSAQRSESPPRLAAVLLTEGQPVGVQVGVEVRGAWPSPSSPAQAAATQGAHEAVAPPAPAAPPIGWAAALLMALAGGVLLNLMPCVFPVLSLKVIGFAAHAAQRRTLLAGGLAYTAGVVVSFVALAALLLALRAGGEQLGWGFQLQSPGFVAGLAALFTLIGLNLAGVFGIGSVLPSSWMAARAQHPLVDSALTGVLAVAVASPCTAPFMGAALGLAFTLPTVQALAIFAALGIGLALPYLLASAWPALARALPRPGPWMAHFKAVMSFPMFGTVVWLVWVLGQQVGIDGAAALLGLLVALAFVAWALGAPAMTRRARTGVGTVAIALFATVLLWALPSLRPAALAGTAPTAAELRWQPWSGERVEQALAQGQAVFVDFTAAWCVTCQFNKRTTFADAEVLAAFDARRVLLLRADWTRRDAAITAELARLNRHGVPVYALYVPGGTTPRLLSELPSAREVLDAVRALP